jgi:hypothetical protein
MIENNGKFYVEVRRIKKSTFETGLEGVKRYMEHIKAEHVLQDAEYFIFVNHVDDVEFEMVEEPVVEATT